MKTTFEEMKLTGRLPSPAGVGLKILQLTQQEDFSADELARTIQSDPALTGRIVKMANAARAAGRSEIKTVNDAVVRLGARAVRNVALGFSLVSSHRVGLCPAFDYDGYWSESLARAVLGQTFAERFRIAPPPETYILGLLSGIGRLALATVHPDPYAELLARLGDAARDERRLAEAESEVFGIQHFDIARCMMEDWRLPEAFGIAAATFRDPAWEASAPAPQAEGYARVLRLAAPAAECFVRDVEEARPSLEALRETARRLGLTEEDLEAPFDHAAKEWRNWGEALRVATREQPPFRQLVGRIDELPRDASLDPAVPASVRYVDPTCSGAADDDERREPLVVLAIDDDAVSRRLLARHLEKEGYEVHRAEDGPTGLARALEIGPHIIVCDWHMPGMDGLEICRSLRRSQAGCEVYFVLLTGEEDNDEGVVQAFDAGVDDFVTKPFDPRILLSRVAAGARLVRLKERVARDGRRIERQVAQLAVLNRKLNQAIITDVLTDLPNRRAAIEELNAQWERRDPTKSELLSVVMVDIDHFKRVNDSFGHDVGDAVLKETAAVFRSQIRHGDTVCRVGGEEFLVVCPGASAADAVGIAERLREAVAAHRISFGGFDGHVTCSFGVAERTADMQTQDDLLKAADIALYRAKESGRNRVRRFDGEPAPASSGAVTGVAGGRRATER